MNHVHLFHICNCFNVRTLIQMTHSYAYTSRPVQWIFQFFIPITWDSAEKLCEVIIIGINHALYWFHHGFRYGIGVHYKTGETQTDFHFDYSTIFLQYRSRKKFRLFFDNLSKFEGVVQGQMFVVTSGLWWIRLLTKE